MHRQRLISFQWRLVSASKSLRFHLFSTVPISIFCRITAHNLLAKTMPICWLCLRLKKRTQISGKYSILSAFFARIRKNLSNAFYFLISLCEAAAINFATPHHESMCFPLCLWTLSRSKCMLYCINTPPGSTHGLIPRNVHSIRLRCPLQPSFSHGVCCVVY